MCAPTEKFSNNIAAGDTKIIHYSFFIIHYSFSEAHIIPNSAFRIPNYINYTI